MMLEILLALLVGVTIGCLTGLFPGIHINLVAAFLLASLAFFLTFTTPLALVIFIVSMSITHTFLDFIPSIYLGAPDDTGLAVMPGHHYLLEGKGHEAVIYTSIGCLYAAIFSILLTPLFIYFLPKIYPFTQRMMSWLLVLGVIFLISREQNSKLWALIIFILSGFLGIATFNLNIKEPLLPLLSGLFGSSTLLYSISQKTIIPSQTNKVNINKKELLRPFLSTSLISPLCSFLPGLGSSQAAILSSELGKQKPTRSQFLILLGSVNIIVMSLSFSALYAIQKSRTGSAAAVSEILNLNQTSLLWILLAILLSALVSFFLAIKISKIFAKNINKINYSKISILVLLIITSFVAIFSGLQGFLVYLVSTSLGLLAIYTDIRRGHLMGCLLIPTILYYLPFF